MGENKKTHLSPEITRQSYQKRHSLNVLDENHICASRMQMKRPSSMLGLSRNRANSSRSRRLSSFVFRVIVIGSKAVGKTALVRRYVNSEYTDLYSPTVSDVFEKTLLREEDNAIYMLRLYDTAGDLQYEFPAMFAVTVMEGDMFIMVYSVENLKSFKSVEKTWTDILSRKDKQPGQIPTVLVGNKADVSATRRMVSEAEGQALADSMKCPFLEVSAKTGGNQVEKVYDSLLAELSKQSDLFPAGGNMNPGDLVAKGKDRSDSEKRRSFSLAGRRKSFKSHCSVM